MTGLLSEGPCVWGLWEDLRYGPREAIISTGVEMETSNSVCLHQPESMSAWSLKKDVWQAELGTPPLPTFSLSLGLSQVPSVI